VYGYSYRYIGVRGVGANYGGYFQSGATGVYGYSSANDGVIGQGGSGSGDYGGFFRGFEGARGIASGSNGYGTWGTASGTYGIGAYGSSTNYVGVYGSGDEYGGAFHGDTGVFGRGYSSSGRGVYGYAAATYGEGVRGQTAGYGGDGVMGYATNSYGYGGDFVGTGYAGFGLRAQATGTGAYAGFFNSTNYRGIYANGASGWYDGFFPNCIYVGGYVYGSCGTFVGTAVIARNDGAETLEAGDLVVFNGFDALAADSGEPALSVAKAGGGNGAAVVGVVQGVYVMETFQVAEPAPAEEETRPTLTEPEVAEKELAPLPSAETLGKDHSSLPPAEVRGDEEPAAEVPNFDVEKIVSPELLPQPVEEGLVTAKPTDLMEAPPGEPGESNVMVEVTAGRFAEGSVEPGQYAIVTIQGFVPVKVDALQPIRAGDWVVALPEGGVAAVSGDMYARALSRGAVSVGRALESLESGSGTIYVYVNFR
jgi:hypothetical protein